jgi:DNA-binding CsgD family transcriptional regulator
MNIGYRHWLGRVPSATNRQELAVIVGETTRALGFESPRIEPPLTEREREVLRWTAIGKTTPEVARILALSDNTIQFHIKNASLKLGAAKLHSPAGRHRACHAPSRHAAPAIHHHPGLEP